jgi:hypothetical protein
MSGNVPRSRDENCLEWYLGLVGIIRGPSVRTAIPVSCYLEIGGKTIQYHWQDDTVTTVRRPVENTFACDPAPKQTFKVHEYYRITTKTQARGESNISANEHRTTSPQINLKHRISIVDSCSPTCQATSCTSGWTRI